MGVPSPPTQWALSLGISFMILGLCLTAASQMLAFKLHRRFIFKIVWFDVGMLIIAGILVIITISGLLNSNDMSQYEYVIAVYAGLENISIFLGIIESTDRFCAFVQSSRNRMIIKTVVWAIFALSMLFIIGSGFIGILIIYPGFFAFAATSYYANVLNPFLTFYYNAYLVTTSFMDFHFLYKLVQAMGLQLDKMPDSKEKYIVHNHVLWVLMCLVASIVAFCVNIAAAATNTYTFSNHLNCLAHSYRLCVFVDFGIQIHELLGSEYVKSASANLDVDKIASTIPNPTTTNVTKTRAATEYPSVI